MIAAFFATKLGRSLILAGAILATASLTYWLVRRDAYAEGVADCQAKQAAAIAQANVNVVEKEREQSAAASHIARESDDAAARATGSTDEATIETKEVIRNVYVEVPVATACVPRALDERVQDRFDAAVDRANRTGG